MVVYKIVVLPLSKQGYIWYYSRRLAVQKINSAYTKPRGRQGRQPAIQNHFYLIER